MAEIRKPIVFLVPGQPTRSVDGGTRSFWGEPFDSWRAGNLVGTPEQVLARIREYQDLGCGGIVAWCSDLPEHDTLRLFAEQVLPELR